MKGYAKSHKMNINLNDSESIENAVKSLQNTTDVIRATEEFLRRLVEDGAEYARDIVPVESGELRDGIESELLVEGTRITGKVVAKADHAAYVEYGVGVVGEGTYPGDTNGYEYNVPSMYKDETGGWWYGRDTKDGFGYSVYTHGYAANPFMFNTANEMRRRAPEIAREVMNDYSK